MVDWLEACFVFCLLSFPFNSSLSILFSCFKSEKEINFQVRSENTVLKDLNKTVSLKLVMEIFEGKLDVAKKREKRIFAVEEVRCWKCANEAHTHTQRKTHNKAAKGGEKEGFRSSQSSVNS